MLRTELNLAVFLCLERKNRVWSECHRLGSFGRKRYSSQMVSADLDSSRFGPFLKRATAIPHGHRLGSFGAFCIFAKSESRVGSPEFPRPVLALFRKGQ